MNSPLYFNTKATLLLAFFCLIGNSLFSQARIVLNSDFEQPLLANPNSWSYVNQNAVPGWHTTSSSGMIEIWRSPFQGVTAASGQQHIELNANQPADLYFDACMFGNETINWSFFHRGRSGLDSARLLIGPPGAEVEVLRFGTNNNAWVNYTGNFVNTFGNTAIRFRFQPISTANGNLTVGNFIDDVQIIGLAPIVEFEQPTYSDLEANGSNLPRLLINGRIPVGGLNINIEIAGGTAAEGTDFINNIVFNIPEGDYDGNTSIDISSIFSILDDGILEGDETVVLQLRNPQLPLQINDANCDGNVNLTTTYTILDDDFLLAVELSSFDINSSCEANLLTWTTGSEYEHAYFAIEHSKNGIEWTAIGRASSLGDSESAQSYSFEHAYPTDESYYRLKIMDIYGAFEYSNVLYANKPCLSTAAFTLYPNPVEAGGIVKVSIPEQMNIDSYQIIDMQGRVLKSVQLSLALEAVIEVDIQGLPAGVYQFIYLVEGAQRFKPFIIL